jgi:hypothetical protein
VRGRPSIAGTVQDAVTGRPLGGARVELTGAAKFAQWLEARAVPHGSRWDELDTRPDRVRAGADGRFLFVDLPAGRYTVVATLPEAGTRYGSASATAQVPADARADVPTAEIALPPTTVKGTVKGPGSGAVALAQVTVQGSGESALTDGAGAFTLAGIETGTRAVRAERRGFEPVVRRVKVATPGATKTTELRLGSDS